ncbi:MAG: HMA2 domain-containing protein [Syntrophobacteraceae bacterium]
MADRAIICHQTPDRVRLRIPSRKGDAPYFARIRAQLEQIALISRVETSALTGSVLLFCRDSSERTIELLRSGDVVAIAERPPVRRPLATRTVESFRGIDAWVERSTGGELDLPGLALVGLVVAGVYQIVRGNFAAPAWYTAFWYAASIALKAAPKDENNALM